MEEAYQLCEADRDRVSSNSLVIACIDLANYSLEFSTADLQTRKTKAYTYLAKAEEELSKEHARFSRWVNIYGIKSDFAMKEGNMALAEQYLVEAVSRLDSRADNSLLRLEHALHQHLAQLAEKKGDLTSALAYQKRGEEILDRKSVV